MIEIYTEDGMLRPFFTVIEGPGLGNVIRVVVSRFGSACTDVGDMLI